MARRVLVKILDLPGSSACCACGGTASGEERAAVMRQKMEELKSALEADFPGQASVEYIDLRQNPAEKETSPGQLLVTGRYPAPIIVIDGQARFAGSVLVKKIVKAVARALEQ
jgi:disulfide oxidoreductase YuzD